MRQKPYFKAPPDDLDPESAAKIAWENHKKSGRVIRCAVPPYVVNPLSLSVQANGKRRLILDLRYVNRHLQKKRIKYEDWKVAISYFEVGAYMFTFDHQCYLGFSGVDPVPKRTQFYRFTVLPFGLSSAPHIFTKIMKPLVKYWRLNGARIALILDDGWGIASSRDECASLSKTVKDDLLSAGFVSNDDKSIWEPCKSILWLGILWHSDSGAIEIRERRVAEIVSTVCSIIDCESVISARLTGQIISTDPVVGSVSRIMTRHCFMSSACAPYWDAFLKLEKLENCLVVPPVVLIARVLHYLKVQRALATLVIPFWPSSSFWPLITFTYAAAVQGYVLEDGCRALMHGRNTNSLLGSKSFRGQVAGIRFDFRSRQEGKLNISKVKWPHNIHTYCCMYMKKKNERKSKVCKIE